PFVSLPWLGDSSHLQSILHDECVACPEHREANYLRINRIHNKKTDYSDVYRFEQKSIALQFI
ncbi:MAG: hypothetical protein AAGA11_22750, partial [Pseudomonadota bacterium]